jgi:hypothetical protein
MNDYFGCYYAPHHIVKELIWCVHPLGYNLTGEPASLVV